jgi:16S rRNA (uracil1498-N3)-methyltransferase
VERLNMGVVALTADDSRHVLRSLRLREGEAVTLGDGRGRVGFGQFVRAKQGRAEIQVDRVEETRRPKPTLSVVLAPPKGDRLRWAIQKLGELGVDETVLVETERSVRAWSDDRVGPVLARLRTIAREAAMQSRQAFIMEVSEGGALGHWVRSTRGPAVVLWEGAQSPLQMTLPPSPRHVDVIVGPEGGFSEREIAEARDAGANVASIGPNILRTETAAVVAATLALSHYGRLG